MATKAQNPYQEVLEMFVKDIIGTEWCNTPFTIENQAFATNGSKNNSRLPLLIPR